MKISIHPMLLLAALLAITLFSTGCPVGIGYPLCAESDVEKVNNNLLGSWKALDESADILEVKIEKKDDHTYQVTVLEEGEDYMMETDNFFSWTTKLDGHSFIFSKPADIDDESYYLYHYTLVGDKLTIQDVGLLVGGVDAVTSTESFREEVSASLKKPDCFSSKFEYTRQ